MKKSQNASPANGANLKTKRDESMPLLTTETPRPLERCAECDAILTAENDGGGIEILEGFICVDCDHDSGHAIEDCKTESGCVSCTGYRGDMS